MMRPLARCSAAVLAAASAAALEPPHGWAVPGKYCHRQYAAWMGANQAAHAAGCHPGGVAAPNATLLPGRNRTAAQCVAACADLHYWPVPQPGATPELVSALWAADPPRRGGLCACVVGANVTARGSGGPSCDPGEAVVYSLPLDCFFTGQVDCRDLPQCVLRPSNSPGHSCCMDAAGFDSEHLTVRWWLWLAVAAFASVCVLTFCWGVLRVTARGLGEDERDCAPLLAAGKPPAQPPAQPPAEGRPGLVLNAV
eukprot:TRINITY_DN2196_c1_g1_i1.p2 TRINITY_DN2196_c1_g1~~TRINITY_DN2196_c1_g1_i1.p2  ORF type:complete len:285 (+),score=59.79 TRINITY_DN2196_c1_g1_i1:95-856(+)